MYTVSDYLVDVVKAMGANNIFGVPGDYNLDFLDHITSRDDIKWTGNANELNAAYMTDGYAKKNGFGAFVTTYGVGELSAMNGLGGSIAENVPVLEIVGAPNTSAQKDHAVVHHTFGDGHFKRFSKAHEQLGVKEVNLTKEHPIDDINSIIKYMKSTGKPVYLTLPIDVGKMQINASIANNISNLVTEHDNTDYSTHLLNDLTNELNQSKRPVVIVGHEIINLRLNQYVKSFIQNNNLPFSNLGLGKGAIDETLPQFIGTYNGKFSAERIKEVIDNADLVILLGLKLNDFITGLFTQSFDDRKVINIKNDEAKIYGQHKDYMQDYNFKANIERLPKLDILSHNLPEITKDNNKINVTDKKLTQDFYDKEVSRYVQSGDTLVAEQGTSFSGLAPIDLKKNVQFIGQPLWGSIGYAFPAMLGSQIADPNSRNILSTGEGSLQLTIQELGMAFREELHPIILILDNSGYTIERAIHGMHESYNNVPKMNYTKMPDAFGAQEDQYLAKDVTTEEELDNALQEARNNPNKLALIQVHLAPDDVPGDISNMGKMISDRNEQ